MTITTPTYWDIDGTSLNTYAYNITTLGDGRLAMPGMRGSNIEVPYRMGNLWTEKTIDASELTLAMWVLGLDEDGDPGDGNYEATFDENLAMLRRLMWRHNRQKTLTKRFWRDGSVISASTLIQYRRGLEPNMQSPGNARMAVTFAVPDPFFYGEEVVVDLEPGTTVIEVDGDYDTNDIVISIDGGVTLTNQTASPDLILTCTEDASINVKEKTVGGFANDAVLEYSGSNEWFSLFPGSNTLVCSGGEATITYRPAYF